MLYEVWVMLHDKHGDRARLEEAIRQFHQEFRPDGEAQLDREKLYHYACVSFARAVVEKRDTPHPYGECFREHISNAKRSLSLFRQICHRKVEGSPNLELEVECAEMDTFEGLVDLELFRLKMADGDYEEALGQLAEALWLIGSNAPETEDLGEAGGAVSPQVDLQAREAIHCFEKLREEPTRVKNWGKVREACVVVHHCWVLCDLDREEYVYEDDEGYFWTAAEYWASAVAFAESRLSPDQFRAARDADDREHAEKHLRLLFEGCWDKLPDTARDALVQAETVWWSTSGSSKSSVVDNLWKAAVEVIRQNMWSEFVSHVSSGPMKELPSIGVLELADKPGWAPGLDDFIRLMWGHPCFPEFVLSLKVAPEQRRFLLHGAVSEDLRKLNALRNRSMHRGEGERVTGPDVSWAYRTFMGIDCVGILPRLARLKR